MNKKAFKIIGSILIICSFLFTIQETYSRNELDDIRIEISKALTHSSRKILYCCPNLQCVTYLGEICVICGAHGRCVYGNDLNEDCSIAGQCEAEPE